jgi:hypothetical protein
MPEERKLPKFKLPPEVREILRVCPSFQVAGSVEELVEIAAPERESGWVEVAYDVPGKGRVVEAVACRVRNGVAANYLEPYMRRRDPDCMTIADDLPTNKPRYHEVFGAPFDTLREATFDWLKQQDLILFPFIAGSREKGVDALVVAPANAGFFAFGLALLQGIIDPAELPKSFLPKAVIYVAPPFRHTHFNGKQMVVHNRRATIHELFSYNLYPGPSAKKGIYGVLINVGEQEDWLTAHCSTVQVVTPYDNKVTIMHEGASGGGKSEMLEAMHRERDGRIRLGHNVVTDEDRYVVIPRNCALRPVTDDMALCHPALQKDNEKLYVADAENAWFIRVNHITHYGTDPNLEGTTIHAEAPLLFLNINAAPGGTALIWDHIEDAPGKPCPNPRVVVPREVVPEVVKGAVRVDIRSFGVRCPPCTKELPTYGILGLLHVLPPALAWLWRLVAPRGYANPSITVDEMMSSEGVGSYWPFATGRRVDQANLLLKQIVQTPKVRYILIPNQHLGAWQVGFMPQWLAREYLARRGGAWFTREQAQPARCPLLGYTPRGIMIEGQMISNWFVRTHTQPEIGDEAYDAGAKILSDFFRKELEQYLEPDLMFMGKQIIECCLNNGSLEDYCMLLGGPPFAAEE